MQLNNSKPAFWSHLDVGLRCSIEPRKRSE
jgi:hypothetical protein